MLLTKLIGKTPLIKIIYNYKGNVRTSYFKAEWYNLTGSIKDRPALQLLIDAYKNGKLVKKQPICEVTSGNMGISIAAIGNILGNPVTICIPNTVSKERIELLKMYGAEVITFNSFNECFEASLKFKELGYFLPKQFENDSNVLAHYNTTGPEIYEKIPNLSSFIAGIGTGGTLIGTGKYLKEKANVKLIAVEPEESMILSTGIVHGSHGIEGLSDDLIPKLYNKDLVDEIICVSTNDSIAMAQKLAKEFGLGVGISSGANFLGSVLSGYNNTASVFSDDNKKYISTKLNEEVNSKLVDEIELISFDVL